MPASLPSRDAGIRRANYTQVAVALHWVIAVGILALIAIGLAMTQLTLSPMRVFQLFQLHKSIGITVLLAVVLRLAWRLGHRPPPLPVDMPPIERGAAHASHWLLYILMFGLPLTGWAVVSASPFNIPTVLFGLIPWPDLPFLPTLADKASIDGVLSKIHAYGAWFLIALLVVHIAAALRHHLIVRDDVLTRMLPARPAKSARHRRGDTSTDRTVS